MPTFRDWVRAVKRKPNGELVARIGKRSSDTLSTIKYESPVLMQQFREANKFAKENASVDDYPQLRQRIREQFPGLSVVSDECLKELIDHQEGKLRAGQIYDKEVARFTEGEISAKTSKKYRLPSKESRQRKQAMPGRPPKNRP